MLALGIWTWVGGAAAQPRPEVPGPLLPWVDWVLDESPELRCGTTAGETLCDWPAEARLELGGSGGRLELQVFVDRAMHVVLPGGPGRWPLDVRVDGKSAPVLDREGPAVLLSPGAHRIEGRFEWAALPERLPLPATLALVALSVDGRSVPLPRRDAQGQLWVGQGPVDHSEGDRLSLTVTRKLSDGVPLQVTTRIAVHAAGRAREVQLGHALLDGTQPLSIESELPARLSPDGTLHVQLRAGSYRITVDARAPDWPEQLQHRGGGDAWPDSEAWVWQADEALRQVELSGPPAVDPARTELEKDWRDLPAFLVEDGTALKFKTARRGEPTPPPNRVTLERDLWLDLGGEGYTARDALNVELHRDFRLDLLSGELGHAAIDGQDVLITRSADGRHSGVELRSSKQQVVAEWRARGGIGTLPAVGWSQDVQLLSARVHMGPGYSVLGVRGADSISQSWVQDWDLFELFVVLLVAIATARLLGRASGALALCALVLCHAEPGAPALVFFGVLFCHALVRVLPDGWVRSLLKLGYWLSVAALLWVSTPFLIGQVRGVLYPQLAPSGYSDASSTVALESGVMYQPPMLKARVGMPTSPAPEMLDAPAGGPPEEGVERGPGSSESYAQQHYDTPQGRKAKLTLGAQQDPAATVQTGPGVPQWSWRSWYLHWSGPVDQAQEVTLYIVSPLANRVLGALRVLLLAALIALLLRRGNPPRTAAAAPAAAVALACCALLLPSNARADFPDPDLLEELRSRLAKPPACAPQCASIESLLIEVGPSGLRLSVRVHAGALTSVSLPGPADSWTPAQVQLDGKAAPPVRRHADGFLRVRVEPGSHVIEARGPLPATDTLTLAFSDLPHHARVRAEGFKVDGVREDGRVEQAVAISRVVVAPSGETLHSDALPPWLLFTREIVLGVRWQAFSRLTRVSPVGTPLRVRVPLLPGESVIDSGLQVDNGELQVSFGRDQESVEWTSTLTERSAIELTATRDHPWSEEWRVMCGPIWHCEFSGLTPTELLSAGRLQPLFRPRPGERLSIQARKPRAAPGTPLTLTAALLDVHPGSRLLKGTLELDIHSSGRSSESLTLPTGARVQELTIDTVPRPIRVDKGQLKYAIEPGQHKLTLEWQQPADSNLLVHTPAIDLGRPAANGRIVVRVPEDRWLLWASGPAFGPAVLFWGYLVLLLGLGLLLGRLKDAPLRGHEFMLLGAGLTQIPALAALVVVGWFFALAYRARMPEQPWLRHDLMQLALLMWTLFAAGALYAAIHAGLLMRPDMQVAGADSNNSVLNFIVDRVPAKWPVASVLSVPLWVFRVLMLLWSLWLAVSLVRWASWAFGCYAHGGLWKRRPRRQQQPQG